MKEVGFLILLFVLISFTLGQKALYWTTLLIVLSVLLFNVGKYNYNISTPNILE